MARTPSVSRYQQLVAGFAASAFALLGMLSVQQQEANVVTADLNSKSVVMTNYRASSARCLKRLEKAGRATQGNARLCFGK